MCKFICTRFVDFVDKRTNNKVQGYITYVFYKDTNEIIKTKMVSDCPTHFDFGDDVLVSIIINGNYAYYSFKGN